MKKFTNKLLLISFIFIGVINLAHAAITVNRTSTPIFFADFAGGIKCSYASFQVTSSTAAVDVWADISGLGSLIALASTEDGKAHIGSFTAGQTKLLSFYLCETTSGVSTVAQSYTIKTYDRDPSASGVVTLSTNTFSYAPTAGNGSSSANSIDTSTISAAANKVTVVSYSPTSPSLGGQLTIRTQGDTGTIGAAGVFSFTPSFDPLWPVNAYELTNILLNIYSGTTCTGIPVITVSDVLYYKNTTISGSRCYTIDYVYKAIAVTAISYAIVPNTWISSGAQIKYTGSAPAIVPQLASAVNAVTLSKTVSTTSLPATGGIVTYTVAVKNAGSIPVDLDSIVDVLPVSPASVAYVAGSSNFNGAGVSDPTTTGSTLSWNRFFTIPANSTVNLTYQAVIPGITGSYTNKAVRYIGNIQIDTTLSTTDNAPATAVVSVGLTDMAASISAPTSATAGSNVSVTVSFANISVNPAPNATFNLQLSTGLTGVNIASSALGAGTYDSSTGIVSFLSAPTTVAANTTLSVVLNYTQPSTAVGITATTTATNDASSANNAVNLSVASLAVIMPNLSLTKSNPASFLVGTPANYLLTINNAAGASTSGTSIVVNDKLPPNFAFNSAAPGAGATAASCTSSGTQAAGLDLVCTITTSAGIAAGGAAAFTINVTPQAGADNVAGANKAAVNPTGGTPASPAFCTATGTPAGCVVAASITPATAAAVNLSLAKSNPSSLSVGAPADYVLTISNAAGAATSAASIVVNDKLPPNFVFNSAAPGAGSLTVSCAASGTLAAGLDLVCTVTTAAGIAAGGNAVFSVNATPQAAADGVLGSNKATVNSNGGVPADPSLCTSTGTPAGCAVAPPIAPAFSAAVNLSLGCRLCVGRQ
jgi:uncharacterized repeat protein (TIGR01451 family)